LYTLVVYDANDRVNFLLQREDFLSKGQALSAANARKVAQTKRLEAKVYNKVDGMLCVSEGLRRVLQAVFKPQAPIIVAPNAPSCQGCSPDRYLGEAGEIPQICYIGHLRGYEGVDNLVEAMRYLDRVQLTVMGGFEVSADFLRVRRLIQQYRLGDRVRLIEFIPPGELGRRLNWRIDVLVIPLLSKRLTSKYFASPMKLFLYMSLRRPIVAPDLPAIREVLRDGVNAVLVRPDDPVELARGIKRVLEDPGLAERISEKAFRDVQQFSWSLRARKILDLISRIKS